jgi:hypothetical protein
VSVDRYVYSEDLGLTDAEVRVLYPHAVELVGLDGRPCWDRADLDGNAEEDQDAGEEVTDV